MTISRIVISLLTLLVVSIIKFIIYYTEILEIFNDFQYIECGIYIILGFIAIIIRLGLRGLIEDYLQDNLYTMGRSNDLDVPKVNNNQTMHTNFASRDTDADSNSNKPETTPSVDRGQPSSSSTSNTNNSSLINQNTKRSRHEYMSKVYQHKLDDIHERIKTLNLDLNNAKDEKERNSINESIEDEIESMSFISKAIEEEIKKSQIESNTSLSKRDIEKVDKNESEEEPSLRTNKK